MNYFSGQLWSKWAALNPKWAALNPKMGSSESENEQLENDFFLPKMRMSTSIKMPGVN